MARRHSQRDQWWRSARRTWGPLVLAGALMLTLVFAVVAVDKEAMRAYNVYSVSMQPTLHAGETVMVSMLGVKWGTINRGDVVAISVTPGYNCADGSRTIVKRVIGLPGDHLSSGGDTIYVNGVALKQRWPHSKHLGIGIGSVTVPKGQYFVMGDNHTDSCDSRMWGTVPKSYIIGKVFAVIWPPASLKFL